MLKAYTYLCSVFIFLSLDSLLTKIKNIFEMVEHVAFITVLMP